jgi:hypothetical protein
MAEVIWSQDIFSKGELSPLMYGRVTVDAYYNGLKTARNTITYPQGAIGKRFGTIFDAEVSGITDYKEAYFETFTYNAECVYVLIIVPDNILIYLEGVLIFQVNATGITAPMMPLIDSTTIETNFRITSSAFVPQDLVRTNEPANVIVSVTTTEITLTNGTAGSIITPVSFTESTPGGIIQTSPQILKEEVYFLRTSDTAPFSTTTAVLYLTASDAKHEVNPILITSAGTGTTTAFILNAWSLNVVSFKNFPVFDFNDPGVDYSTSTFTPAAESGYNITITATLGTPFTPAMQGGEFAGNGGVCRIAVYLSPTGIAVDIITPFPNLDPIPGTDVFLAEPAWSDARGWPSKCSSFQNRAVFANTRSLPNGLWLSVTNDYNDFDGLELLDDNSIFWYPSSDNVNVVNFIVPYRSLTIHTNSGIYSTPLAFEQAATPATFSMTLQDSVAATNVQPRSIDNQIVVISGNDVHSMIWDGFNSAYTSTIASIASEHLVKNPHDEAGYTDKNRAGSRYMFIVNGDGGMVIYQTLTSENVSGFSPTDLTQTYGDSYFRWAAESITGRSWFMTERQIAEAGTGELVAGSTTDTLILTTATTFVAGVVTAFKISTTTSLPDASVPMVEGTYYWGVSLGFNLTVYTTYADAVAEEGNLTFTDSGVGCTVTPWPLVTKFYLEELSFDVFTDCTYTYSGSPEDTFTGLARFNAQMVKAVGDGFGFDEEGNNDEVILSAHGEPVEASKVSIGFPINTHIETLSTAVPGAQSFKGTTLTFPSHIRAANLMFNNTIGGVVNGTPIQIDTLLETTPGQPPNPMSGVMEITPMLGWNGELGSISITHDEPFDIKLIGIFYRIET